MPEATRIRPAIDGWFDVEPEPHLIGSKCGGCGTYVFPPRASGCPNPVCAHDELAAVALSRTGTLWSYTENRYQPPPPFPQTDPFEPYALAAVSLTEEGIIVLGKVVTGTLAADLTIGQTMELAIEPLYRDDDGDERTVWAWKPAPR